MAAWTQEDVDRHNAKLGAKMPAHVAKKSKYRNVRTAVDGRVFDSGKEAMRYAELVLRQKCGEITGLTCQPELSIWMDCLDGSRMLICDYRGDFEYFEKGERIIEDAKGMKTAVYRLKKKMVRAQYGISIRET